MPEFISLFCCKRKIRFSTFLMVTTLILFTSALIYLQLRYDAIKHPLIFISQLPIIGQNMAAIERRMQLRTAKAQEMCTVHFSRESKELDKPKLTWHRYDINRLIKRYYVWWNPFWVMDKYKVVFCQ